VERLSGTDLRDRDRDDSLARDFALMIGISDREHDRSALTVGDTTLIVSLWFDFEGLWKVRVLGGWPGGKPRRALTLAETYAACITGELQSLKGPEHARFKVRLLIDLGRVEPYPVILADLPEDATTEAVLVWRALPPYLGVRWRTEEPGSPFPLSAAWFSKWNRRELSEWTIAQGKLWLDPNRYLLPVGEAPSRRGKPLQLWMLGTGGPQ
jgi:hypothetical protein